MLRLQHECDERNFVFQTEHRIVSQSRNASYHRNTPHLDFLTNYESYITVRPRVSYSDGALIGLQPSPLHSWSSMFFVDAILRIQVQHLFPVTTGLRVTRPDSNGS